MIIFMQHPNTFSDEQRCVLYASTFLTGTASQWFSNFLIQDPLPPVVTNWNTFVRELNDMFGDRHRSHTAQQALRSLRMVDSNPVNGYVVKFTRWANMTGFDDTALTSDFYAGLCQRLKNQLALTGRPTGYAELRDHVLRLDQHFWDRQRELRTDGARHLNQVPFPPYNPQGMGHANEMAHRRDATQASSAVRGDARQDTSASSSRANTNNSSNRNDRRDRRDQGDSRGT